MKGELRSRVARPCRSCEDCGAGEIAPWCGLESACAEALASARSRTEFGSGQAVFTQGEVNKGVYCIAAGTLAVRRIDAGGHSVLLKLCYPGETLGYRSFLCGGEHKTSAEAIGPATVCRIESRALRAVMSGSPTLSMRILTRAVSDIENAHDMLVRQATLSNRGRLCQLLLQLVARHGRPAADGSCTVHLPVSRRDLASMIGTRHETVSRVMSRLEEEGVARFSGRSVTIPSLEALSLLVEAAHDE